MAKSFKQNPLNKLSTPKREEEKVFSSPESEKEVLKVPDPKPEKPKEQSEAPAKEKKKSGRPTEDPTGKKKKDRCKTVNIAIYKEMFEKIDIAKASYGNNLTEYINALILRDLAENFEEYKRLYDLTHKFHK